jgi:hypothetical protein
MEDAAQNDTIDDKEVIAKRSKSIRIFNKKVKGQSHYEDRRKIKTTPTIYFDSLSNIPIDLARSTEGWGTIDQELADKLTKQKQSSEVIMPFESRSKRSRIPETVIQEYKSQVPNLLRKVASAYSQYRITSGYGVSHKLGHALELKLEDFINKYIDLPDSEATKLKIVKEIKQISKDTEDRLLAVS